MLPSVANYKATTMRKSRETKFAQSPHYQTFILRFWQEQGDAPDGPTWRFSIEDPKRGNRYGFSNLNELIAFLHTQINGEQNSFS